MKNVEKTTAKYLLQIKAIKLEPANYFTWSSGWYSPIYCDNRKTLSYPEIRTYLKEQFVEIIRKNYPDAELIAGVATGGIAIGALIAEMLNLPYVYVRSEAKGHGLENLIEGEIQNNTKKVIVIEDLISTGKSSLKAVEALRNAGCDVLAIIAIFNYQFDIAKETFEKANCKVITLSNYSALIESAVEINYIDQKDLSTLQLWRTDPANWKKVNKHGKN
jgi:orotate phosphoribosyltransferase